MQKFVTSLWFDDQAEEAAKFYTSLFDNSKIVRVFKYGEAAAKQAGKKPGEVLTVDFTLNGQEFNAINGGPMFKFTEAISIIINCKDQAEIDRLWEALTKDGGQPGPCGWLKDKYGLSWQIVPDNWNTMLDTTDPEAVERVMAAMLKMGKLDIAELERAKNAV